MENKEPLINLNKVFCPKCNKEQKFFRVPASFHEALVGGWNCPECGCQMDKFGNELSHDNTK